MPEVHCIRAAPKGFIIMGPIQDDKREPNRSNYAFPIWVLYGPHLVFIWDSPNGAHMEPCCIWVLYGQPIWVPYRDPCGSHMGPIYFVCWDPTSVAIELDSLCERCNAPKPPTSLARGDLSRVTRYASTDMAL